MDLMQVFSEKQKEIAKKHGTPAEFASAVYRAVPGDISMGEAREAIEKYNKRLYEKDVF